MDMSGARQKRQGKRAPARGWYALAVAPMLIGLGVFLAVLISQLARLDDGLTQIVVPGERTLDLQPGVQTVFLETRSVVDSKVYRVEQVPGLTVKVVDPDGRAVRVGAPSGSATYTLGDRQGEAIHVFRVRQPGAYRISAAYDDGAGPETVIAVGAGFMGRLLTTVAAALGAIFLGLVLSIAVAAGVYLARRRAGAGA